MKLTGHVLRNGRSPILRTLGWLAFLLICWAIFAASRQYLFGIRPTLIPPPEAIPASYFGMTVNNYRTTPWPSIPFASLRTWDTSVTWADINPTPNTFNWSELDRLIELAQRHGVDLLFTLGRTPRWASANPDAETPYGPGQCAPPARIAYWDEFLRAIVSHVGGKIRYWETWNEPQSPDSVFYCGDVATMVKLQRQAYEIIKSLDPSAKVLTPSPVGEYGPPWMARFLSAGGGQYADIMAFHGYLAPGAEAESIISTITKFKAVFANNAQQTKPVWDTEAGWGKDEDLSESDQRAAFLAKFYLLHWSAGIQRFYWYAYDNPLWGTLWDAQNRLHKAGVAYREVHLWLQGATMTGPCELKESVWICSLSRQNGYRAIVLWRSVRASFSATSMLVSDEFRQYRDLEGNLHKISNRSVPLSFTPILVETATAS
jgi:hypothetical protein